MEPERWARIEQLCQSALECRTTELAAFLDSTCGADQELRREVESLLAHRQQAENFIEGGAMELAARALAEQAALDSAGTSRFIGRLIAPYRIVEKVASGGMGDVYRAVRADGTFDKQVAIKVIQGARSTDFFLARFQNERQILATLDHPNIAWLLDGGSTQEGLPYLVMEYIQGVPIDEFCNEKGLDFRSRLELFRTVCSAVQYAHQNLVVHRDLKPSNILVTSDGVPKLLDFGVAKILNPQHAEEGVQQTVTMMRLLTPDFASPEQIRQEPISTASDVYSLGVILYLLLTGHIPHRLKTDSPQEMMKAICEAEPEKPSTAAARVSPQTDGAIKPERFRKLLEGDLDNIVLKALKKEPQRRYTTVEQFSEDIRRYLSGLPVLAHKDTVGYRSRKFIGRHRLGVAAAALLILSLAGGLIATLWQARIARSERARAERRFNDVRALANSLIFDVHDSIQDLPGATAARKVILDRALQYLDSLSKESSDDVSLRRELATAYQRVGQLQGSSNGANIGDTKGALESSQKALALWENVAKSNPGNLPDQINVVKGHRILSMMYQNAARPGAREQLERAMVLSAQLLKTAPTDNLLLRERAVEFQWISSYYEDDGNYSASVQALRNALDILQGLDKLAPQTKYLIQGIAMDRIKIANALATLGARKEALDLSRYGIESYENLAKDPKVSAYKREYAVSLLFRCMILIINGNTDEALGSLQKARAIIAAMQSADPANTVLLSDLGGFTGGIGIALAANGQPREALANFDKALSIYAELRARDPLYQDLPYYVGQTSIWRGDLFTRLGNIPEALKSYQKALPNFEEVAKAAPTRKTSCDRATAHAKIGHSLFVLKDFSAARASYQESVELTESLASQDQPNPLALYALADAYSGLGDIESAPVARGKTTLQQGPSTTLAVSWYQKSLEVAQRIQNHSDYSPEGFAAVNTAYVRSRLEACQKQLNNAHPYRPN
jgi:serine/threonine protein kinase